MPPSRNPWKLDRTPGGSSGGAAAAVRRYRSHRDGPDGAGSIRIPAALCGVFGLKPSFGRVPYWPNPDFWAARSHNGPISRTVRDAALMMNVISGPDPRDPVSLDSAPEDFVTSLRADLRGLRIAWSEDFGYGAVDRGAPAHAPRGAALHGPGLPRRGRQPDAGQPRPGGPGCRGTSVPPSATRSASNSTRTGSSQHGRADRTCRSPSGAGAGSGHSSHAVPSTNRRENSWLASTCCSRRRCRWAPGPTKGPPTEIDGQPVPNLLDRLPFTFPFNMTGWPAASVPCGFNSEGLPVALQIVAGPRQDGLCLAASAAFEALEPWAERTPAL